jgi:hypothetical protein
VGANDVDAQIELEDLLIRKNQNHTRGRKPILGMGHEEELLAI